jgi:hypothetical protein
MKQVGVLAVRRAVNYTPVGQENVGIDERVVHETIAEGVGLDADADTRAADRDVLELRCDERRDVIGQRVVDDRLEGREAFNVE